MQALFKPPKIDRKDATSTKSFLLGGVENRRAQGFPVPVGYGRLKIGSSQISSSYESIKMPNSNNADSLESYVETEILELLCEGPVEGFVNKYGSLVSDANVEEGIFLNNVQVKNTSNDSSDEGTYNYILSEKDKIPVLQKGTDRDKKVLSDKINTFIEYKQLLYGAGPYSSPDGAVEEYLLVDDAVKYNAKIFSHTISNPNVGRITVCFGTEVYIQNDDGSTKKNNVKFAIRIKRHDGTFNVLDAIKSGCTVDFGTNGVSTVVEEGSEESGYFIIEGIATGTYQFDININFNPRLNTEEISEGVTFNVVKLSTEYDPSTKGGKVGGVGRGRNLQLTHIIEQIDCPLLYPHTAICKLTFDSKNFSQMPERNYHLKLKKVLIPSNYDPVSRKYDGPWDGLFKGQASSDQSIHTIPDESKFWTDNPSWIFFDIVHNARYGLGKYGIEETNIDKWQLYKIAKYCDELVETDYPIETSTALPRSFKTSNEMDGDDEKFIIKIEDSYFRNSVAGDDVESRAMTDEEFKNEFGEGEQYKGRKVAFFISQSKGIQPSKLQEKSAVRDGEFLIEERTLESSDLKNRQITVSGPSFKSNPATQSNGYTYGACATQLNHPVVETRFSANLLVRDKTDALQAMNSMCSIFRSIVAYSAGKILAIQDSIKNPVQLFSNSNVTNDGFTYTGMHKHKRFTVSLVRFNNKDKGFKPDIIYEEDSDAIQKLGYQENETLGFGITSSSQARRLAKWMLFSSQLETETVKFTTGQDGSYLFPGSIFEISDEMRAGKSNSGRVIGVFNKRKITQDLEIQDPFVLIDRFILDSPVIDKVEIAISSGSDSSSFEKLNIRAPFERNELDQDAEIISITSPQILRFDGTISTEPSLETEGRSGQKTIICNLLLKMSFQVSTANNTFTVFKHGFEDGDRVRFVSDGVLPGGLNPGRHGGLAYYVRNSTKSTFQISTSATNTVVNITDIGKDRLGNIGGLHYVCPEDKAKTQKAVDQIQIGANYHIKGFVGMKSKKDLTDDERENLGLSTEGLSSALIESNWVRSDIFGLVHNAANNGWLYVPGLNAFVFVQEIAQKETSDNDIWFFIQGIGWLYTNTVYKNQYWFINSHKENRASSSGWVYVFYDDENYSNVSRIFIFDTNSNLNKGDFYTLGDGGEYVIADDYNSTYNGYYIKFNSSIDDPDSLEPGFDNQNFDITTSGFDYYKIESISSVYRVDADDSLQGINSIQVALGQGSQIRIKNNIVVEISGVDSNIDGKWSILRVTDTVFELVESATAYALLSSTITDQGQVSYLENPQSVIQRYLQSQLFRVLSVKELSENKYEVTGLEYNRSKFSAVDKKGVIRKPVLPIPPQADMSVPEAPDGLILTDLTK